MLPSLAVLVLLVVLPLLMLVYFSLLDGNPPGAAVTAEEYRHVTSRPIYVRLLGRSLVMALAATALTLVISWPAAWALSRVIRRKAPMLSIVIMPLLVSQVLLIYAMMVLIGPGGPLMTLLGFLGLADPSSTILYTRNAVVLMLAYEHIPLMVLVLYAGAERIDDGVLQAARSLGAGPVRRFTRVVLPLSAPHVIAGLVLVFIPIAGSFVQAQILGGPDGMMLGTMISEQITRINNGPRAAVLSLLLLGVILLVVAGIRWGAQTAFGREVMRGGAAR